MKRHTHTHKHSPITRSIHADDIIYGAGICFSNLYLISFLECYMAYVREFTVHIYIGEKHRGEERARERGIEKADTIFKNNELTQLKLTYFGSFDKYYRYRVHVIFQQLLHGT